MSPRSFLSCRSVPVAIAAAALVAAPAAAAHADTLRHADRTGDVTVTSYTRAAGFQKRIDTTQRNPDLTLLTVRHTADQLAISSNLRAFSGVDSRWSAVVITSKGDRFGFERGVSTGAESPYPTVTVVRNGHRFSCEGIVVSRTQAGMIVRAPASCLGSPWRVRVGVKVDAAYREAGDGDQYGDDDAFRVGGGDDERPVTLSSWVAR